MTPSSWTSLASPAGTWRRGRARSGPSRWLPATVGVPPLWQVGAAGLTYFLLARLGVALGVPPDGISVFWPPNAVILSTFLIVPPARWWAFALAFLGAEVAGDVPHFTVAEAIAFGLVNCFEGGLSAAVLRRIFKGRIDLAPSRQLLYFVFVSIIAVPALAALAGAAVYVAGGSEESYWLLWRTWWSGDAVGLIAIAPLILVAWHTVWVPRRFPARAYWIELAAALAVLAAVTAAAFKLDWLMATDYDRLFYIFPVLVWIALRGRPLGAAAAGTVMAAVVAWMAVTGEIPIGASGRIQDVFFLQQFLAVTILSTLALSVLVQEVAVLNRRLGSARERRRSEAVILRAKEEAERANRAKTTFLAHMSHELRTPLNAIIGFSDIMREEIHGPLGSDRYREYAGDIVDSAQHLLALVNDLIDVSRIESGALDLADDTVAPADAVDQVCRFLYGTAARRGIRLDTFAPPDLPGLRCDAMRVRQVLINIIGNAVKFSHDGGRVDVELGHRGGALTITVRDRGRGIPADKLGRVFQRFQQFSTDPHLRAQGTGLGLYIARQLMVAHGGDIVLDSTLGAGTTVTLTFPADRTV